MHIYRWKIGAPIKRFSFRCQKYIQWPSAITGNGLNGIHIDLVQVRPFFPVDFNINKMPVHDGGCFRIFKTFPFHDMTPVTG